MVTREQVMSALFTLLQTAPGFNSYSRRFKLWDQVSQPDQPALILTEKPETHLKEKKISPAGRTLEAEVWIYIDTGLDQNTVPITVMNPLIDAIDPTSGGVLAPSYNGKQTLGGLVYDCFIDGQIIKVPGDLDGQGVAIIPIKIVFHQAQ